MVGGWVHGIWIVSLIGMLLVLVFGSEPVKRRVSDIYLVRTLGLLAAGLVLIAIAGLLLGFATTLAVMFGIYIPWRCWVYPAIKGALTRVSRGALRAGVVVLAITVTVLAGGVWAHIYAW